MLILTRKVNQVILIDVGGLIIKIKLLDVTNRKAKIGIDAHPGIKIWREELMSESSDQGLGV